MRNTGSLDLCHLRYPAVLLGTPVVLVSKHDNEPSRIEQAADG